MTAQILKPNGEVVYQSTFWHLTEEKRVAETEIEASKAFDTDVKDKLGGQ